jgi:hypothetical protein
MLLHFRRLALQTVPVLLLLSAVLTPMAYASPPDPSWINGLYDGGDFDDVVVQITSGAGVIDLIPLAELRPLPSTPWIIHAAHSFAPTHSSVSLRPRAPPVL